MTPQEELRLQILEMRENYWHGNGPFGRDDDEEYHRLRRKKALEITLGGSIRVQTDEKAEKLDIINNLLRRVDHEKNQEELPQNLEYISKKSKSKGKKSKKTS